MLIYLAILIVPLLLGLYAQYKVKSSFSKMSKVPARMSGAEAARIMLDNGGLHNVGIEAVQGHLSDHYDPRAKVLRLSPDVYNGRSMAALGVACHEAGHAFQDAKNYAPLVIRNAAVPMANFGSSFGMLAIMAGLMIGLTTVAWVGVALFAGVAFFQLVNLPVEFDASNRARYELVNQGLIRDNEEQYVAKVLNAAALTYVAATLQAVLTLLYYVWLLTGQRD
ncbi:MAG: zinc metallopeptidase [Planctomycetota bacterium]